jgi:bis(5'-nucleosyl)-tetraphosphatase (symmetrical)
LATYAIGDIQGCFVTLRRLLEQVRFEPRSDRLWLVGDLVNRGPRSLEVLRWVFEHRQSVTAVLGNHDLYLLSRARGHVSAKFRDTVGPVLAASDRDRMLDWLRTLPLLYREGEWLLVHAGLLPAWSVEESEARAARASALISGSELDEFLDALERSKRRGVRGRHGEEAETLSVMTRIRLVDASGTPKYQFKGRPEDAPVGLIPWFRAERRVSADATVIFGHWATLGRLIEPKVIGLDSGCVWGNTLSALRLDDRAVFEEPYED